MQTPATRHEILVGLEVLDDASYQRYRDGMTPLLESRGGFFRVDLRVSETLKGPSGVSFNRVFVLSFPDAASKEFFFADPAYQAVREQHFVPAVGAVELLAQFDSEPAQ